MQGRFGGILMTCGQYSSGAEIIFGFRAFKALDILHANAVLPHPANQCKHKKQNVGHD